MSAWPGARSAALTPSWRLRRENEDLRTLTKLYAEAIRQLTLDYAELEAKLNAQASVTPLDARRNQH